VVTAKPVRLAAGPQCAQGSCHSGVTVMNIDNALLCSPSGAPTTVDVSAGNSDDGAAGVAQTIVAYRTGKQSTEAHMLPSSDHQ
jgi:hypothetical protein